MNVSQFVAKWRKSRLSERSGSHEHFIDLCHVFDHPTPAESDAAGEEFTFEREIAKVNGRRGRADVWKKDFFAWEYKSKGKDLEPAHDQLRQYRESLLNPPLLAACNMVKFDIRTNFTRKPTKQYVFPLGDLGDTENRRIVEHLFHDPDKLEPGQDVKAITEKAAGDLAAIAIGMRERGLDPKEVAKFLDRVVFCLFAQDVRLLEGRVFSKIVEKTHGDPRWISKEIFNLFRAMDTGGECALERIAYFNGDLFSDVRHLELKGDEIQAIHDVCRLNWGAIDASIFGTLFERGTDPDKDAEIGTHYTGREDISTIVQPVVMDPLRREWAQVRREVDALLDGNARPAPSNKARPKTPEKDPAWLRRARSLIRGFHQRLQDVVILDPACGSGNFLYVSLQKLKDLEKEVLVYAGERNIDDFLPAVGPHQLRGIEKSQYAYDLARVTVLIGWLQWTKANGFHVHWKPILNALDNLKNTDAVLDLSDPENPREPEWPEADFIVGNPPFSGGTKKRRRLKDDIYVAKLYKLYKGRVPASSDLCAYWFEKARDQVARRRCKRVGLIATQSIRGDRSREVLKRIKRTGDIFFAVSDRDWIQEGVSVHVSMIGFDDGSEQIRVLDDNPVVVINPDLSTRTDVTKSKPLAENLDLWCYGSQQKGDFDIEVEPALEMLQAHNPVSAPNSDVVKPSVNGAQVLRDTHESFVIDFGLEKDIEKAALYESPFEYVKRHILPVRRSRRESIQRRYWWLHARPSPRYRKAITGFDRCLITPSASKHRIFLWLYPPSLADHQLIVFLRSDDYFFGVLHSRVHEVWARAQGTQVRDRESGFRYTPSTCFETFPFPEPFAGLEAEIGEAAKNLNERRENWLNAPESTREEIIEFPGSTSGPWGHLVHDPDERGIGVVRYIRRVPKDEEGAKKLAGHTLTELYNERPTWLDLAHRKLDKAVFDAYGWKPDMSDDDLLARLLALNLERARRGETAPARQDGVEVSARRS